MNEPLTIKIPGSTSFDEKGNRRQDKHDTQSVPFLAGCDADSLDQADMCLGIDFGRYLGDVKIVAGEGSVITKGVNRSIADMVMIWNPCQPSSVGR